ncbi:Leucyl/phenylalanyl-tRNA--protein transferase [Phycisphaerae bacterium RAS1]|nr:Leucyl/phenylalanyl-tRNA--protein transferase [Phycisphaerae bacterium RAS1]
MSRRRPPLTPEIVLLGYRAGVFPMDDHGEIAWFSPDPRCIFELDRFNASRSLRKTIQRGVFEVRINSSFRQVVDACADRDDGTWISAEIKRVYCKLFEWGLAHSVETWRAGALAGGLYGVAIGGAFFGESMFHRATDASKVAMAALVERLRERDFQLLDAQWITPHLESLGATEISRDEYLTRLESAINLSCRFA